MKGTVYDSKVLECEEIASGLGGRVFLHAAASDDFYDIEARQIARLLRVLELWTEGRGLTKEQVCYNEGRAQKGNINQRVEAFKTHKIRLYGFVRHLFGKKTFIIVDCDLAKKQDKADRVILAQAKQRIILFEESFGAKYE